MASQTLTPSTCQRAGRQLRLYLGVLVLVALLLGFLHLIFGDVKAGGIYWFNLDKERNLPTWYSGALLFLLGCVSLAAYLAEEHQNRRAGVICFRLPKLWWGVAAVAFMMSLDEITILHENLLWRQVRLVSSQWGKAWAYLAQWQIVFAPAILLILGYFVLFFTNRFHLSRQARGSAYGGVGCWTLALLLEGLQVSIRQAGPVSYLLAVVAEELLEMVGTILLLASIAGYAISVALDFTPARKRRILASFRFLTRRALMAVGVTFMFLFGSGAVVYFFARIQADSGAPVPRLVRQALQSRPQDERSPSGLARPASSATRFPVWFREVAYTPPIPDEAQRFLVGWVESTLFSNAEPPSSPPGLVETDPLPRIVFLSLSDGETSPAIVIGSGRGIWAAMAHALFQAQDLLGAGLKLRWLKLDLVRTVQPVSRTGGSRLKGFERGREGIALSGQPGAALLPEQLIANQLLDGRGEIRSEKAVQYIRAHSLYREALKSLRDEKGWPAFRFTTDSYFTDGRTIVPLSRGHRTFGELSAGEVLASARLAGQYLLRSVGSDGQFIYRDRPGLQERGGEYNMLRHAGSVYSMLELSGVTQDKELLAAAGRGLQYLLDSTQPSPEDERLLVIVENGWVKLGGNALAVIALAKYVELTRDLRYLPDLVALGKWILKVQGKTGQFLVHKESYPGGRVTDFTSDYYPGEALLALLRLHTIQPSDAWLDAAEKGARYLIQVRDRDLPASRLPDDHWLLYALNELYRYRSDPLYLRHASRLARAIVQRQNRDARTLDWVGGYHRPPRSAATATRSEGLLAAYHLIADFGDQQECVPILKAIQLGVRFQLQTQFRPESVLYFRDPQRFLGAFHRSLTSYEVRIDYLQHNISSLLGVKGILKNPER
ncbi:MAG: hypothetical protein ACE5JX_12460 [Acidobacteriota bacterium]